MDATQQIEDTYSEEEEDETKEKQEVPEKEQVATLKVFKNDHIPETGESRSHTTPHYALISNTVVKM